MKTNNLKRNSLPLASLLTGAVLISGFYLIRQSHTRQYSSDTHTTTRAHETEKDDGARGMMQYFFNARKNITTGKMDYAAMATANAAANKMQQNATERTTAGGLSMTWTSMGPGSTGGRTRGILVDNQDPSGNTLFACAVTGGIWKSVNGGSTWDSVPGNDQLSSMEACDIAQDKNGVLYVGTGEGFDIVSPGEGFSSGEIGGGIFKSTDDGNTWAVIPSTIPPPNSDASTWSYVNRIAVDPNNPSYVYAATHGGLMGSQNGGTSWAVIKAGYAQDVKISPDGSVMFACVGGSLYYTYPTSYVSTVTLVKSVGAGKIPIGNSRIEIAISPTNPNYAYVSVIHGATFGSGSGIFMTMTAKTNGGYWYDIGPGGGPFDPYSSGGIQDQADYDNAIAVSPVNPGKVYVAGTTLWSWYQNTPTDTIGSAWTNLVGYGNGIHPDMHALTFDPANPSVMYDGNDGGVYKSYNAGATGSWQAYNRNYNVTQFNCIAFAPNMSATSATKPIPEGVIGGTQDNGTPYISGLMIPHYTDGVDKSGGDGGGAAISQLAPNIFFVSSDNDFLGRGDNLSGFPSSLYTTTIGDSEGANIDSMVALGQGCFYNQIALYENIYDTNTVDSMLWVADTNYTAGTTVYPVSPNGSIPFPYKLTTNVTTNDTIKVKDLVVSKLAEGLGGATAGVWVMAQAIDISTSPIWMPIGSPHSTPDAFAPGAPVHCMAWSPDGNALFVGTENGQLFRFSNLNAIQGDKYYTGATYGIPHGSETPFVLSGCVVVSNKIDQFAQDVLSIAVDPKNGNNIIVTLGNYGQSTYVYYSSNALDTTPTFASAQGNLPKMPIYSSVLNVLNSGAGANTALVGSERGIWSTTDINNASPTWVYTTTGGPNTLVMGLKQQTLPPWMCNNTYNVYAGTHGRGAWVSQTYYQPLGVKPVTNSAPQQINVNIYPNPMTTQGTLAFTLPKASRVTIAVYDLNGRMVKNIPMDNQSSGNHYVSLNAQSLSTGTYIATVSGNGFFKSVRFVVVR